jgi:hypothetical protein
VIQKSLSRERSPLPLVPARAVVEILRRGGGLMPRALLGATFTPTGSTEMLITVRTSGPNAAGEPSCVSQLAGDLVPGLPDEFGHAVVEGIAKKALLPGRFEIDRSAFDPVESSPFAFGLAADILAVVLEAIASGRETEHDVRTAIDGWQ